MTLKECIDLGRACGCITLEEHVRNVYIHATSLFVWKNINNELDELIEDIKEQEPEFYEKHFIGREYVDGKN